MDTLNRSKIITSLPASTITVTNNITYSSSTLLTVKRTLTAAEVLALNGTPITLIAAPGATAFIDIVSGVAFLNYNSVAFTAQTLNVRASTQSTSQATFHPTFVSATASRATKATIVSTGGAMVAANDSVVITSSGAIVAGNSTIDVYLTYRIVTV